MRAKTEWISLKPSEKNSCHLSGKGCSPALNPEKSRIWDIPEIQQLATRDDVYITADMPEPPVPLDTIDLTDEPHRSYYHSFHKKVHTKQCWHTPKTN